MSIPVSDLELLPGAEIVLPGLADLQEGHDTIDAAAVLVAFRRLRSAGVALPAPPDRQGEPGHHLYHLLIQAGISDPHSRYNAILRRIESFARTLEGARAR